jgi:hypothetical protein
MTSLYLSNIFDSHIENMQDRENLVNIITSQKWKPNALRKAIEEELPHIFANMTLDLGMAIDLCAFEKVHNSSSRYFKDDFNNCREEIIEQGCIVYSKQEAKQEAGHVFSVDWMGAFTLILYPINLAYFDRMDYFRSIDLFILINSQNWTGPKLRSVLEKEFPEIFDNLTMDLASTIDTLAFHNDEDFDQTQPFMWCHKWKFPNLGDMFDVGDDNEYLVKWVGAFTFQFHVIKGRDHPQNYD